VRLRGACRKAWGFESPPEQIFPFKFSSLPFDWKSRCLSVLKPKAAGDMLPTRRLKVFRPSGLGFLLDCLVAGFVCADTDRLFDRGDKDFAIADLARLGGLDDC
jgi:hypothetical protein